MSEEVKIKISQPLFEVGELERFDNNIHNIIEEYSKLMFKEKDQILTQRIIMKQEEEIERLKDDNKYLNKVNIELSSEKNRLKSIIKEVREYINKIPTQPVIRVFKKELLEILGGENNDK